MAALRIIATAGAEINARDAGGRTALHTAVIFFQKRLIVALEHAGAATSFTDNDGHTARELATNGGMEWPADTNDADAPRNVLLATQTASPVR